MGQSTWDGLSEEARLAYMSLDGRCITKKITEYKYEICFFRGAKQDHTSVGSWRHWEGPHVALFDGGQWCPGGPDRSLRVRFLCGAAEEIVDVYEPSRCAYEASLTHPAACDDGEERALNRWHEPRRPSEEL